MIKNRLLLSSLFVVICVILGLSAGILTSKYYRSEGTTPAIDGFLWPAPKIIPPFSAVNQDGARFTHEDLEGKWSLLFYGYTHCPDICPVTMAVLQKFYEKLESEANANNVQVIFISVDPGRDTPEKMAEYTRYFHKDFIGLTGSKSQVDQMTRMIGIAYVLGEKDASGNYLVDHSASIFLVSPEREWIGIFTAPHQPTDLLQRFQAIRSAVTKLKQ